LKNIEIEKVPLCVFVRKKKNRSGSISIAVVSKQSGRYKEIHVVGIGTDPASIEKLYQQGLLWIEQHTGMSDMFTQYAKEQFEMDSVNYFFNTIESILFNGTQLILNQVFKLIGFDRIEDAVFRQLVISRICQPMSKVATVDYLKSHFEI